MQIILFALPTELFAQNIIVQGIVTSSSGEPLVGVSILVKDGNNRGTVTDLSGKFTIKAEKNEILTISYIGFKSQDVVIDEKPVKIILEENSVSLNDVVVVGYGAVKKSDLTGSVGTINTENLKTIPANSIEGLLQGRSAGLQITNSSQNPDAGSIIRIRGGSSLRASNSPLLVVDGFPVGEAGDFKQINPADIKSVEVLKDASASAIYGSRGANGVIMITTRNAKNGTSSVTIKQQTIISQFASNFERYTDPVLMAQLDNEAKINGGLTPLYTGSYTSGIYYPSVQEIQDGTWKYNTDWTKVVFRDHPISNNTSISVNSANDKTSFNVSGNYFDQKGVYINDDYSKEIVSLNVKHKVSEKFEVNVMANISKNDRNDNTGLAYWRNPLWPIYNADGTYFLAGATDFEHPLALTEFRKNKTSGTDFIGLIGGNYEIIKGLKIRSQLNYKYGATIQDLYNPPVYTFDGNNNNGAAYLNNWCGEDLVSETYLTYDKEINNLHKINLMLGQSYEHTLSRSSNIGAFNFTNSTLNNENMSVGDPEKNTISNGLNETQLLSFMGRLNYTLDNKYLLTATFRSDASSKFGANNRWANFPSAALSWKAHNEDFIKQLGIFDELKLRASYGISGNQGISPYQTLSKYGQASYYIDNKWNTAIGPGFINGYYGVGNRYRMWGGIANKDLKWETTSQYDIGLDMAFFKKRLRLTLDYYYKHTYDLLRERYLTLSSGFDKMWVNDGEIGNRGFEVTVDADLIKTKDWNLSGTFIYSMNRNKVLSLGNAISSGLITDHNNLQYEYIGNGVDPFRETSPNILAVGQPVNVFYGYRVDGIIQTDAEGLATGLTGAESKAGEFKYVDISKNGVFDTDDRVIIGDPNPDFTASLNLSLSYKRFDIGVFLNGVFGNDVLWPGMYNSSQFIPLRWTVDNHSNEYPSNRQGRLYYVSDWFIKDGSYLRIQNINFGYTLNTSKIKWVQGVHIYVNTDNIYTFTKFKGYDPEVGVYGIYSGGYPRLRNWTLGIDLTF